MCCITTPSGLAIPPRRRPSRPLAPLTREQIRRIRHEDWRRAHDEGVIDPDGVVRKRSMRLIARLSDTPYRTVWHGIIEARRLREAIRAHADELDIE